MSRSIDGLMAIIHNTYQMNLYLSFLRLKKEYAYGTSFQQGGGCPLLKEAG